MSRLAAAAGLLFLLTAPCAAQQGSPYVSLEGWILPLAEHLIRMGAIPDPDPLTRPFRRSDLRAALARADTSKAAEPVRALMRQLFAELQPRGPGPRVRVDGEAGGEAATHARRDPLRSAGPRFAGWHFGVDLWTTIGPLALSGHPFWDRQLDLDPDYPGAESLPFPFRFTDAYVSVQPRYAQLTFGTLARNWGPPQIPGLILSPEPYSYDHLYVRLGVPALRLESQLAQLNSQVVNGQSGQRWWIAHRFVFRPWPWIVAAIGQAVLWWGEGPGSNTLFLNPTHALKYIRDDAAWPDSSNAVLGGDLWLRLPRRATLQGSILIDDFSFSPDRTAPQRVAATFVADAPVGDVAWRALFTTVASLSYRTFDGPQLSYLRHSVGLGRNFSDYWQATVSASWAPGFGSIVSPEVTLLRQGEGDIRAPMPPAYGTGFPTLLVGVTEQTWRLGLTARARAGRLSVDANAGIHLISNQAHVAGVNATKFVGGFKALYYLGGEYPIP